MLSGYARRRAEFGQGNGSILMDDVWCTGYEDSIIDCGYRGISDHDCDHSEDAGVVCGKSERKVCMTNVTTYNVSITDCRYRGFGDHGHNCCHSEDAGVVCGNADTNLIILRLREHPFDLTAGGGVAMLFFFVVEIFFSGLKCFRNIYFCPCQRQKIADRFFFPTKKQYPPPFQF